MPYPLYPKTGIHWSEYGITLAADSIINHVEKMNPSWDLPDLYWDSIEYVDQRKKTDDDIELALNLIERFPNFKMAYPKIKYDNKDKDSINVIVISDSFFWRMFKLQIIPTAFTNGQFWYYNHNTYPKQYKIESKVSDLDLDEEIKNLDVIILMATEGNLSSFPWKAEENLFDYFSGNYSFDGSVAERKINRMEDNMRSNKQWLSHLKGKAISHGIPLDSMIRKDAIYMIQQAEAE